jgi:MFS family permease
MSFFFFFIWGALTAFFPLYAIHHGVENPGLFFTMLAVMLILSRVVGARLSDLYSSEKVILPCLITFILSMVVIAFSRTLPMFILAAVIWGIGHAYFYPALVVYVLERVGSSRGLAMGTLTALTDLGIFLGPVSMGVMIHFTSYPVMFLCLALIGVINLGYFYFFLKGKRYSHKIDG